MSYDDVGSHLSEAGSFERAAVPLGVYLAWCANHHLLSDDLARRAETLVLRVRFREIPGSELAVAGCGGVLGDEHLNPEGQAFTARHYRAYGDLLGAAAAGGPYAVEDEWALYDEVAPELTRWLMDFRGGRRAGRNLWWKVWK